MRNEPPPWTLESLVDFEQALATSKGTPQEARSAVIAATHTLGGAAARRAGLRVWLDEVGNSGTGRRFASALAMVSAGLCGLAVLAGISAVLAMLDRAKGGVNVVVFLAVVIGGQWLLLMFAAIAWMWRRKAAEGFSGIQALAARLARKFSGNENDGWWQNLMEGGGSPRAAVLWRTARLAQAAGVCFNLGVLAGLTGLVLVRHVGFYWETTTEEAMRTALETTTVFLSAPWSAWQPASVPDAAVIDASRWLPDRTGGLPPGPAAWWRFLLLATLIWGLLPRGLLWLLSWHAGHQALAGLDFQGRAHRALWRDLTGAERIATDEKPLDGVLVLDVGGSGLTAESLRPYLLRRLRVHPTAWHSVAVLDAGAERESAAALSKAPAGVVLLAEGWSLSPARMAALHAKIRSTGGPDIPIKFLIANVAADQHPVPPTPGEQLEWERFVDSLRDPTAEVFAFAENG